jgi:hypothetical protein
MNGSTSYGLVYLPRCFLAKVDCEVNLPVNNNNKTLPRNTSITSQKTNRNIPQVTLANSFSLPLSTQKGSSFEPISTSPPIHHVRNPTNYVPQTRKGISTFLPQRRPTMLSRCALRLHSPIVPGKFLNEGFGDVQVVCHETRRAKTGRRRQ